MTVWVAVQPVIVIHKCWLVDMEKFGLTFQGQAKLHLGGGGGGLIEGGGLFEFQTPTPTTFPTDPPKVFEPVLLQIEIFGESVGAEKNFGLLTGFFFFYPTCLYSK